LLQSIEGGLIIKPFCDLLVELFEDSSDGTIRISTQALPLIRAMLGCNRDRQEILRRVSQVGQFIIRGEGIEPRQLAVVFAVHDLQADISSIDMKALTDPDHIMKVRRDFDRWNAVWGTLMNYFEVFEAEEEEMQK
ncbi:hypothetical protein HDU67_002148, partial [Dinochytrium kinnereticum]